jgi:hypothetical protein
MRPSNRLALVLVPFLAMLGHAAVTSAQTAKPDPVLRDVFLRHWTEIGDKIVKMAEDFLKTSTSSARSPACAPSPTTCATSRSGISTSRRR